jgi:hypothetical protein
MALRCISWIPQTYGMVKAHFYKNTSQPGTDPLSLIRSHQASIYVVSDTLGILVLVLAAFQNSFQFQCCFDRLPPFW